MYQKRFYRDYTDAQGLVRFNVMEFESDLEIFAKCKLENEANYFATKLLYSNLEIEEGIETKEQLANALGIKADYVEYLINKE